LKKGVVIKSTGTWYSVKSDDNELLSCKMKGSFRIKDIKSTNPIAVGDRVEFVYIEEDNNNIGLITSILERKNYIIRKSTNLSKQSHIIASNIDQAFLVVTINYPVTTTSFIDRFLVSAEAYRIPCHLVFNKLDRFSQKQLDHLESLIALYSQIGYLCFKTSVKQNIGIDELALRMKNKTNVFSGHSGVGKSSIINIIQPGLNLKTKEISDSHFSGKHTTTYSEMYDLDFGGYIIDTPGIKGFGMLEMENWEISHYFPEMFRLLDQCQYYNCSHTHEPGCAVKNALAEGLVSESRYNSYLGLLEGDEKYRI